MSKKKKGGARSTRPGPRPAAQRRPSTGATRADVAAPSRSPQIAEPLPEVPELPVPDAPSAAEPAQEPGQQVLPDPEPQRDLEPAPAPPATTRQTGWERLWRSGAPRWTKANIVGMVLAVGLGFAMAATAAQGHDEDLEKLTPNELVGVLDNVSRRAEELRAEEADLLRQRDALRSGTANEADAAARAKQRLDTYRILGGTVATSGPGVTVVVDDPQRVWRYVDLLDAVQELRAAGAEAISVGDVRVVASTHFATEPDGALNADGVRLEPPYTILAIGDPATLSGALNVPGGVVQSASAKGATVKATQSDEVTIRALHTLTQLRSARAVDPADANP